MNRGGGKGATSHRGPTSHQGSAFLMVVVDHVETQRRPIAGLKTVTIGRGLDCDVWLDDPVLSRKHCQLEPVLEGDGWAVVDLNSRNGTYVNAVRVMERRALNHKDVITIGKTHVVFHAHGYIPPRPSDPAEALLQPARTRAALEARLPTPHHSTRPLPTPKVFFPTSHDSTIAQSPGETLAGGLPSPASSDATTSTPLPFTRPPARPIVRPADGDDDDA